MCCNLVLERSPLKSSVVLADNYMTLSCLTFQPPHARIHDRFIFFFSLGAISNQHFSDSNLGRQGSSWSNSTYAKLHLVQENRTF